MFEQDIKSIELTDPINSGNQVKVDSLSRNLNKTRVSCRHFSDQLELSQPT